DSGTSTEPDALAGSSGNDIDTSTEPDAFAGNSGNDIDTSTGPEAFAGNSGLDIETSTEPDACAGSSGLGFAPSPEPGGAGSSALAAGNGGSSLSSDESGTLREYAREEPRDQILRHLAAVGGGRANVVDRLNRRAQRRACRLGRLGGRETAHRLLDRDNANRPIRHRAQRHARRPHRSEERRV